MDDTLRLIQHLYGEDEDGLSFGRRLREDDALRREYEELRDTKAALDRRPSRFPAPDVVDNVVEQAREAAHETSHAGGVDPAPDRPGRPPRRRWGRRLRGVSAVLAVLLLAGVGWWQFSALDSGPTGPTARSPTPPSAETATARGGQSTAPAGTIPEWDDQDEVVRLYQHIERLQTRNASDEWGGDPLQTIDRGDP